MTKLIVADDHPLFRNALINAISATFAMKETIETDSFDTTCEALDKHPDTELLLLDLHMPGNCGFFGLIHLRKHYPTLPIVVISASDDIDVIRRVITFGASAFIPKSSNPVVISDALKSVLNGDVWVPPELEKQVWETDNDENIGEDTNLAEKIATLTQQQYKVLYYVNDGWLNKQIAWDLNISEATVKAHMTAIFRKLGVSNRTQAVILASRLQLEPPAGLN